MESWPIIRRHLESQDAGEVEDGSMLDALCNFYKWCQLGACTIRLVTGESESESDKLVPMKLKLTQRLVLAKMMDQAAAGKPVRLKILKSRKTGISTFIQCLFVFLCQHYKNRLAMTIAHEARATNEIFRIAQDCYKSYMPSADPSRMEICFGQTHSRYFCQTAGGIAVGAGATVEFLHRSEIPMWERNKQETITKSGESVKGHRWTIIVDESTARGREEFFNSFDAAHDPAHAFDSVFIAWYLDEDCVAEPEPNFKMDDEERAIVKQARAEGIELSNGTLQWRRDKIRIIDLGTFRQEYPSTPAEAIQGTKGLIYPTLRGAIIDELPADAQGFLLGGIDFGFSPDATIILTGFHYGDTLYVVQCYRRLEGLARHHVEALEVGAVYFCDPGALTSRKQLEEQCAINGVGCKMVAAPRVKAPGDHDIVINEIRLVQNLLEQGFLKILRSASDQLLIEADNYHINEKTGQPDDRRGMAWGHYDALDALRYMVMGMLRGCRDTRLPAIRERRITRQQAMRAF